MYVCMCVCMYVPPAHKGNAPPAFAVSPLFVIVIIFGQTTPFPIPSFNGAARICVTTKLKWEITAVSILCPTVSAF